MIKLETNVNGIKLPEIAFNNGIDELNMVRKFSYDGFKVRLFWMTFCASSRAAVQSEAAS